MFNTTQKLISISLLLLIALTSCNSLNDDCVKENGERETRTLNLNDFTAIEIRGAGELNITYSESKEYTLTTSTNIFEVMTYDIQGNTLIISNEDCIELDKDLVFDFKMPQFTGIIVKGSADVKFSGYDKIENLNIDISGSGSVKNAEDYEYINNLDITIDGSGDIELNTFSKKIDINISGSGDVELDGVSDSLNIDIAGSGNIEAYNLETKICNINILGSGDTQVYVLDILNVKITGSGDVYYKGQPKITTDINGSGDIVKVE